ncbi:RsmB/NOP family class I SAM-dependent RNA methyltransferase [Varibaculum vaginae]|uniref:RsmB/NOP family class I SAM-dependent RNA methyltransferase n=1 Tax=Varibaculum vaginae TaxID=2364797 RepID=UPI000F088D38|nr:transcription antitermination factor NusB [Varibaculum vaginae]
MRVERPRKKHMSPKSPRSDQRRGRGNKRDENQQWRPQTDRVRTLVFQVLLAVETKESYANLLLPPRLTRAHLGGRDAAFATELTYGTLRAQGYYDWLIDQFSSRPVAALEKEVLIILRMGLHQLLNMRVPTHAAVSESVNLTKQEANEGAAGLVNGVLRQVARLGEVQLAERLNRLSPQRRLAIKYSHPAWIIAAYRAALSEQEKLGAQIPSDDDSLAALLAENNRAPYINLVARPGLIDREELADAVEENGQNVAYSSLTPWGLIVSGGDPATLETVVSARAGVEDQGSQLVAGLAAQYPLEGRDNLWLDLCAGPGGKAALLAALGQDRGAQLIANEISPHRARLVQDSVKALDNVQVVCKDGTEFPQRKGGYDRVLVDAPCTGLGALRRHPESRYRSRNETIPDITGLQAKLLQRALELCRPGGLVIYATCSPHPAETTFLVQRVLQECPEAHLMDLSGTLQQLIDTESWPDGLGCANKYLQLWPHIHSSDAMFAVVMSKEQKGN